jgi:predicted DNA-binding protein
MTQTNCRIDKEIYDRLAEYSKLTSVPVSRCIAEACERWLTTVAPARLDQLVRMKDPNYRAWPDADLTVVKGGKK